MKRLYFLAMACFVSCVTNAQGTTGYEIKGHISGLREGEKIIMGLSVENGYDPMQLVNRDSEYVRNGQFLISGFVPEGPRTYWIDFDRHQGKTCILIIDNNEKVTISSDIDIDSIRHTFLQNYIHIEGSRSAKTLLYTGPAETAYSAAIYSLIRYLRDIKDSVGFDSTLVGGIIESRKRINLAYYNNFYRAPDTGIVKFSALLEWLVPHFNNLSGHSYLLKQIYDQLDDETKKIVLCQSN